MKLRQRLAVVLAATMVVTAVPAVTFAASDNKVSKAELVKKDEKFSTTLTIELKDKASTTPEVFFLELKGGEFSDAKDAAGNYADVTATGATVKSVTGGYVVLELPADAAAKSVVSVNIKNAKATDPEVTLSVDGQNSVVTSGKFIVAKTNEAKAIVKYGDVVNAYEGTTTLSKITLEEPYPGYFQANAGKTVSVTLEHDDYEFVETSGTATPAKGLAGTATYTKNDDVDTTDKTEKDAQVVYVTIPGDITKTTACGTIEVAGLKVKSTTKTPEVGDMKVTVAGQAAETTVKVADVKAFGVTLEMKDKKVVETRAGQTAEVTFTFSENVADTIANNREMEFRLDKGHFAAHEVSDSDFRAALKGKIKDQDGKTVDASGVDYSQYVSTIKDDKKAVGFTFNPGNFTTNKIEKFTFTFEKAAAIHVPLSQEDGKINIAVSGPRAFGPDGATVEAVSYKAPVKVSAEAMTVKVGLKKQTGGKLVLTETDKGMFAKAGKIVITPELESGLTFTDKPSVKLVGGDLKLGDIDMKVTTTGQLEINIKRASKEASTIEITDFAVKLDRTVPQGNYKLTIAGDALVNKDSCGDIAVADFIIVGTPNTEDIASNGLKKGTASFVIDSNKFIVNGVENEMDAAAYIDAKSSRTMVPVRYLADAFGVEPQNILVNGKLVTIIAGNRTIQLEVGSNKAVLNGSVIPMQGVVVEKAGRTYVPVSQIASLLGISGNWDAATKTATFENK